MVENWHRCFWLVGTWPLAKVLNNFLFILGFSFNFQTNTLSNGRDSLTNQCFFGPRPWPKQPLPKKKKFGTYFFAQMDANFFWPNWAQGGRDRLFFVHRVTEWQIGRVTTYPLPVQVGEIFVCPFFNYPTRFARRRKIGVTINELYEPGPASSVEERPPINPAIRVRTSKEFFVHDKFAL